MEHKKNYQPTIYACFTGYVVQAVINNFVPLLFLTFHTGYNIPMSHITFLVTVNFGIQLCVDLVSAAFVDKIGYRLSIILAHLFAALGLIGLTVLPELLPVPLVGILISVGIYAVGGGLIEVLISPIVESCPTDNKEKAMSLLHSFYCWGHVAVVLVSTAFFRAFGIESWKILTALWALIPIANAVLFARVPIAPLIEGGEKGMRIRELFRERAFWILFLLMLCAGASELSVSQWASTFAERGLGVTKAVGDLAGPLSFAFLMGISRAIYGRWGDKINLHRFMAGSSILCVLSYLLTALGPHPVINLLGCALCGLSVGILWPGTFSRAAATLRRGGTAMFALLALAGDIGCAGGPTLVGLISGACSDNLKIGILAAVCFPILMILGLVLCSRQQPTSSQ